MEAQKTPVGTRSAFELSPLKRAAAAIERGNARAAEAQRLEMSKRAEPKAGFVRMSRAAELLNAAGNHKLPLNGLEIASFNRARLDPTTSAPTAPKATSKATTAATKAKQPLTLAERVAALSPAKKAELKANLDAMRASKPTAKVPAPAVATKPSMKPVATAKPGRWAVAMAKLNQLARA
jgi:hypothetical protein